MDAAITGAQVAYNHDRIQKTISDHYITTQANRKLFRDTNQFDGSNISVTTFHQVILITGQIPSKAKRDQVTELLQTIAGVKKIYNFAQIIPPISNLSRVNDTWITTKIKAQLIATNDIDPDQIKVITENRTVFLMGIILEDQADIVIDIARNTDGVQNVIKLLTYLRVSNA